MIVVVYDTIHVETISQSIQNCFNRSLETNCFTSPAAAAASASASAGRYTWEPQTNNRTPIEEEDELKTYISKY